MENKIIDNPLISIIIPVYNVEQYLDKCIQSIINQDYKNFELLLVDDGSSDKSGYICDNYAEKDSRIKVLHQQNGGQSVARNNAIKIANGDFYTFIDSDDYIDDDYLSSLLSIIIKENAQLAVCGVRHIGFPNQIDKENTSTKPFICTDDDVAKNIILGINGFSGQVSHMLVSSTICKEELFPVGVIYEDLHYILRIGLKTKKAVSMKELKYNYVFRPNNSSAEPTLKRKESLDFVIDSLKQILSDKPQLISALENRRYIVNLISFLGTLKKDEKPLYSLIRKDILKIKIDKKIQPKYICILYSALKIGKVPFYVMNNLYEYFRKIRFYFNKG